MYLRIRDHVLESPFSAYIVKRIGLYGNIKIEVTEFLIALSIILRQIYWEAAGFNSFYFCFILQNRVSSNSRPVCVLSTKISNVKYEENRETEKENNNNQYMY